MRRIILIERAPLGARVSIKYKSDYMPDVDYGNGRIRWAKHFAKWLLQVELGDEIQINL
jgi:hypothetical protein